MADYKDVIKNFHHAIENLEDTVESKNLELRLLESELTDSMEPCILGSDITYTISEMLMEIITFIRTKGTSDKTEKSKNRLLDLLKKTERMNSLATKLIQLKATNREMYSAYQRMRVENNKLKNQIQKTADAHNF